MKQDKQDRRSQRTRHLVNAALLELLFERHYDTITIQDILDRSVSFWIFSSPGEMVGKGRDAICSRANGAHLSAVGSTWRVGYH